MLSVCESGENKLIADDNELIIRLESNISERASNFKMKNTKYYRNQLNMIIFFLLEYDLSETRYDACARRITNTQLFVVRFHRLFRQYAIENGNEMTSFQFQFQIFFTMHFDVR